jgi:hemoglobin
MERDITCRADIELLINTFYDRVRNDEVIGRFFAHVQWEKHLKLMYDFWENTLFYTGSYAGNPLKIHMDFHTRSPLSSVHFKRWEALFLSTLSDLFFGEKTELARQRAISISTVMQVKMFPDTKE